MSRYFVLTGLACMALVSGASAMSPDEALSPRLFDDWKQSDPIWVFDDLPGGQVIEYNGTVEGLHAYVSATYPDQLAHVFDLDTLAESDESIAARQAEAEKDVSLWKRQSRFAQSTVTCFNSWKAALIPASLKGLSTSGALRESLRSRPGPRPASAARGTQGSGGSIWT